MRDRLLAVGATLVGRVFETNVRFEDRSRTLRKHGILLRLRRDDRIRLTFKSKLSHADTQFKVHRELEVEVGDFRACHAILEGIGFHPEQTYEKWRETFVLNDTKFLIDTMPYGLFLEIEGEKDPIRAMADQLGLRWEERILLNYVEIFEVIQREEDLSFRDITFDNFKAVNFDIKDHLYMLYAG